MCVLKKVNSRPKGFEVNKKVTKSQRYKFYK